jgi:hypothetical protein
MCPSCETKVSDVAILFNAVRPSAPRKVLGAAQGLVETATDWATCPGCGAALTRERRDDPLPWQLRYDG